MPYDETLATRVRGYLGGRPTVVEKKMFGGLSFMLGGNLCVGILEDTLIARVGPDQYEDALEQPHAGPFDFTGRPMRGWVRVQPEGIDFEKDLEDWVDRALEFVETLPKK